jgi:hypothetical protein
VVASGDVGKPWEMSVMMSAKVGNDVGKVTRGRGVAATDRGSIVRAGDEPGEIFGRLIRYQ